MTADDEGTTPTVVREPLAIRAAVVALCTAILHLTVVAGWWAISPDVEGQVALVIDLAGTAVLVVWSRGKLTPVADPRDDEGRPLVPADVTPESYKGRHRPPADPSAFDQLSKGDEQ